MEHLSTYEHDFALFTSVNEHSGKPNNYFSGRHNLFFIKIILFCKQMCALKDKYRTMRSLISNFPITAPLFERSSDKLYSFNQRGKAERRKQKTPDI